jgi:hypothetical protein
MITTARSVLHPGITITVSARITMILALILGAAAAPTARADDSSTWGINGTYSVVSNGEWAQTNDRYQNEAVVRSTWTISTTCTTPVDCTGTVKSDQGWSAPVYTDSGASWYVKRTVPGWEPCPNGTAADGEQTYRFYPVDPNTGLISQDTKTLTGEDRTIGASGACGISLWLSIKMPITAVRIS